MAVVVTDLATWLLAQIAADEAAARAAAAGGRWHYSVGAWTLYDEHWNIASLTTYGTKLYDYRERMPAYRSPSYVDPDANGQHIARHDPARVLAECAAKRAIVELHKSWPVLVETPPEFTSDTTDLNAVSFSMSRRMMWLTEREYRERFGVEPPTAPIIRLLAQPYAGREGWREEWRGA